MPDGTEPDRPIYGIGAVARMLGIPAATLRTWQERYAVVVPKRSEGGHRLYTRGQVEQLRFVAERVTSGLSPADGHRLLQDHLAGGTPLGFAGSRGGDAVLILVAEHEPFAAEFAEFFLRTEGYDVTVASDAQKALFHAAEAPPDLAIIDLLIPGGSGHQVCEQLSGPGGLPVVAISSLNTPDGAMAAGASAFIRKPVEPLQLVSTVKDLLGRSAFLQRNQAQDGTSYE